MFRLGRSLGLRPFAAALCGLALAAHAWHVRWTALSMETSTAVLAMVAVGMASTKALTDSRSAYRLGFFMALASLVRPEAYLLAPVYIVTVVLTRDRRLANAVRTLGIYAALMLPWLLFARFYIGSFLPNTAGAKSGGLIVSPVIWFQKLEPIAKIAGSAEGVFLLLVVLSLPVMRRAAGVLSNRCRFLVLWVVALPAAYVLFDIQVLSRYMLLTSPFVIVLGIVALEDFALRFRWKHAPALMAGATLVAVAINIVFYTSVIVRPSRAFSRDLTHKLKSLATVLKDRSQTGDIVAAADIGYLAFYSERHVLDLGGLVETVTNDLREQYSYEEIVERGLYLELESYPRVDYFIDRESSANRFQGKVLAGYRFESVHVEEIDNLGIRRPGPIYYTLYRLHRVSDA
jgi:hypothetical protein